MSIQLPTNNTAAIIDDFILYATTHLSTVGGVITTVSLYPPLATPGPGVISWLGYQVQTGTPTPPPVDVTEPTTEELLAKIPDDNNTIEGAQEVVGDTGVEVLTDGGEDGGEQIEALKDSLPEDRPPYTIISSEEAEAVSEEEPTSDNPITNKEPYDVKCNSGKDYDGKLSPNFRLRDLSIGCVFPHKIKAQVGLTEQEIICNLQNVAQNILEPLKAKYPNMKVNSAFRGTASIPGKVSQHQRGEAVDVQFTGVSPQGYLPISNWIKANLPFDQMIFEHGNSIWIHLSCKRGSGQRKQLLTMLKGKYEPGIKCYYA